MCSKSKTNADKQNQSISVLPKRDMNIMIIFQFCKERAEAQSDPFIFLSSIRAMAGLMKSPELEKDDPWFYPFKFKCVRFPR